MATPALTLSSTVTIDLPQSKISLPSLNLTNSSNKSFNENKLTKSSRNFSNSSSSSLSPAFSVNKSLSPTLTESVMSSPSLSNHSSPSSLAVGQYGSPAPSPTRSTAPSTPTSSTSNSPSISPNPLHNSNSNLNPQGPPTPALINPNFPPPSPYKQNFLPQGYHSPPASAPSNFPIYPFSVPSPHLGNNIPVNSGNMTPSMGPFPPGVPHPNFYHNQMPHPHQFNLASPNGQDLLNMAYQQQSQHFQMLRNATGSNVAPSPSPNGSIGRTRTGSHSQNQGYFGFGYHPGMPTQDGLHPQFRHTPSPLPSHNSHPNANRQDPNFPQNQGVSNDWNKWRTNQTQNNPPPTNFAPPQTIYSQQAFRGSNSSLNSGGSESGSVTRRTDLPPGAIRVDTSSASSSGRSTPNNHRVRTISQTSSNGSSPLARPPQQQQQQQRERSSSVNAKPTPATPSNNSGPLGHKPSPLSQQAFRTGAISPAPSSTIMGHEEEEDRPTQTGTSSGAAAGNKGKPKSGITGKLRRALSMSALQLDDDSSLDSVNRKPGSLGTTSGTGRSSLTSVTSIDSGPSKPDASSLRSGGPPRASSSGKRFGLLNSKMNGSTDNISISSTVSSASVMIRKLGNMGKSVKRSSLMGLSNLFNKDKDKEDTASLSTETPQESSKLKKKTKSKAAISSAKVTYASAELERGGSSNSGPPSGADHGGMTPAQALVSRHQKKYAEQDAAAAALRAAQQTHDRQNSFSSVNSGAPSTIRDDGKIGMIEKEKEKLKNKRGKNGSFSSTSEEIDGFVEVSAVEVLDDGTGSQAGGFDEDDNESLQPPEPLNEELEEYESSLKGWNQQQDNVVMPHRRKQTPSKGILKGSLSPLTPPPGFHNRSRANSYDAPHQIAPPNQPGQQATLAQFIPSEAQIDGLSHSATKPRQDVPPVPSSPYNNPALNVSAPVLQNVTNLVTPIRSVSTPAKKSVVFARELSFHTTFPAQIYDRKSELATCNRLTPQLAQMIKEELNAFKLEEMAVHDSSRIYTHFFV